MQKIIILGHKGMLGNAVHKYFASKDDTFTVTTIEKRWGTDDFEQELKASDADIIINCIGLIPQKRPLPEEYRNINIELPLFLETLGKKIIHPSTDCEFSGAIKPAEKYSKQSTRDATDPYGKSKAEISRLIETTFSNTKIIRTSIIGHEEKSNLSLLDWFLNSSGKVNGYTNHYWNGITTLEWAKLAESVLEKWNEFPVLNQFGTTDNNSKYDLLKRVQEVYNRPDIIIQQYEDKNTVNKCLTTDIPVTSIVQQLKELRQLYKK